MSYFRASSEVKESFLWWPFPPARSGPPPRSWYRDELSDFWTVLAVQRFVCLAVAAVAAVAPGTLQSSGGSLVLPAQLPVAW